MFLYLEHGVTPYLSGVERGKKNIYI